MSYSCLHSRALVHQQIVSPAFLSHRLIENSIISAQAGVNLPVLSWWWGWHLLGIRLPLLWNLNVFGISCTVVGKVIPPILGHQSLVCVNRVHHLPPHMVNTYYQMPVPTTPNDNALCTVDIIFLCDPPCGISSALYYTLYLPPRRVYYIYVPLD